MNVWIFCQRCLLGRNYLPIPFLLCVFYSWFTLFILGLRTSQNQTSVHLAVIWHGCDFLFTIRSFHLNCSVFSSKCVLPFPLEPRISLGYHYWRTHARRFQAVFSFALRATLSHLKQPIGPGFGSIRYHWQHTHGLKTFVLRHWGW